MTLGHELAEAVAAGVLVLGGGLALAAAWRKRLTALPSQDRPGATDRGSLSGLGLVWLALAAASAAAGIIHAAVAPEHLDEWGALGSAFVVAAALQLGWAAAATRGSTRRIGRLDLTSTGLAINTAILVTWVVSRTVGVPLGNVEEIGRPDIVAGLLEATIVAALTADSRAKQTVRNLGEWLAPSAAIAWVPVVGVIFLATVLGLASGGPHGGHH